MTSPLLFTALTTVNALTTFTTVTADRKDVPHP
jgi:hypothetical protein